MSGVDTSRLRKILSTTVGPVPWYWQTFPSFRSLSGQQFVWTHHGSQGSVANLVTLGLAQETDKARLALNTYCRPFSIPPHWLGIWCPEGRSIRIACFDPDQLKAPGTHKIEVPQELQSIDELIVPTSYKAMSNDEPAFALFVFYLQAGLVEVLPQRWFTAAQYRVGQQWIPRAARDPESQRIFGECFGVGTFLLEEDGCRLAEWLDRSS